MAYRCSCYAVARTPVRAYGLSGCGLPLRPLPWVGKFLTDLVKNRGLRTEANSNSAGLI
jgi:hypothetical protein